MQRPPARRGCDAASASLQQRDSAVTFELGDALAGGRQRDAVAIGARSEASRVDDGDIKTQGREVESVQVDHVVIPQRLIEGTLTECEWRTAPPSGNNFATSAARSRRAKPQDKETKWVPSVLGKSYRARTRRWRRRFRPCCGRVRRSNPSASRSTRAVCGCRKSRRRNSRRWTGTPTAARSNWRTPVSTCLDTHAWSPS